MRTRTTLQWFIVAVAATSIGAAFGGCSANTDDATTEGFEAGTTSPSATTGTTGAGGNGGAASSSDTSVGSFVGSGGATSTSTGTGLEDGGQCASASAKAQLTPLDMIIILDQSGSMEGQSWTEVTAAIKTFVADPKSAGIGIGINYFPADAAQGDECSWQSYALLEVPIATLPDNAQAMSDSIDAHMPTTDTPMYPALKGALAAGTAYQDMNPTHKVVVVLATDGEPSSSCGNDSIPLIAGLAESALNYDGVQTYTIAVTGADLPSLDQVSAAGGTGMSYDATNVTLFEQQMEDIRTNAVACDFPIPPPPDGKKLDVNKVNVSYTPGGSTTAETLPRADNLQDCGTGSGWYYDDPVNPTKIELCPASCTTVQADTTAELDVLFGCQTMIN